VSVSAADPLNLVGINHARCARAGAGGKPRFCTGDGMPVAVQVAEEVKFLEQVSAESEWSLRNMLLRKRFTTTTGRIQ